MKKLARLIIGSTSYLRGEANRGIVVTMGPGGIRCSARGTGYFVEYTIDLHGRVEKVTALTCEGARTYCGGELLEDASRRGTFGTRSVVEVMFLGGRDIGDRESPCEKLAGIKFLGHKMWGDGDIVFLDGRLRYLTECGRFEEYEPILAA